MASAAQSHKCIEYGRRDMSDLIWELDRARYHARHWGLAAALSPGLRFWHFLLEPRFTGLSLPALAEANKRFTELLETDIENVEKGYYPRELLFDFSPVKYLKQLPDALKDIPDILQRKYTKRHDILPQGENTEKYPPYYRRTFHWQKDGWFSRHSAEIYDGSVEFLFLGTADVMRRMVLPMVADAASGMEDMHVLDMACGTGRFLCQLHRMLPEAELHGVDLSPHYIQHAHDMLHDTDADLRAENAEKTSFKKDSFDAVTCIYLFHELPADARRRVMREAWRVLKPGGHFVVLDSAQLSDSRNLRYFLEAFPVMYHEPYYKNYLNDALEDIMEECGFSIKDVSPFFVSKRVTGRKPSRGKNAKKH